MDTPSLPSIQLLAANQRLYELRKQHLGFSHQPSEVSEEPKTGSCLLSNDSFSLPLGWGSERVTAVLRTSLERHKNPTPENKPATPSPTPQPPPAEITPAPPYQQPQVALTPSPVTADCPHPLTPAPLHPIKVHPSLALGMFVTDQTAVGRIWLLLHHLDPTGRGWLEVAFIREQLSRKESPLRACGWRQLRNLLQAGQGTFWERDRERVWLRSPAKVAVALGVEKLVGAPVAVPVAALCGGVGEARAHLYAAFHSSRNSASPISRETLERLTHIPARTQRAYEETAGVGKQRHIAIGERHTAENVQKRTWWQGTAVFDFIDHHGRQGPEKRHYVAWHLPNSYTACHERSARGRKRKINREIDLVSKRTQGNGSKRLKHLFHSDGSAAGEAYNRVPYHDHYWPCGRPPRAGCGVWWVMPGMQER